MNNTPETPYGFICYKLFTIHYSLFIEPHVSGAFLSTIGKKDEPSSEYCGVVNFCKNCLLHKFVFLDSL